MRRANEHDPAMNTVNRSLTVLLVSFSTLLAGCGSDDGGPDASPASPLGQEFVLGFDETIHVGKLSLEFTTLAEESRCPASANCVWQGNASILVTATRGRAMSVLQLNTNPQFPVRAVFEGYAIELRSVDPYPMTTALPNVQDYEATLFVDVAAP